MSTALQCSASCGHVMVIMVFCCFSKLGGNIRWYWPSRITALWNEDSWPGMKQEHPWCVWIAEEVSALDIVTHHRCLRVRRDPGDRQWQEQKAIFWIQFICLSRCPQKITLHPAPWIWTNNVENSMALCYSCLFQQQSFLIIALYNSLPPALFMSCQLKYLCIAK